MNHNLHSYVQGSLGKGRSEVRRVYKVSPDGAGVGVKVEEAPVVQAERGKIGNLLVKARAVALAAGLSLGLTTACEEGSEDAAEDMEGGNEGNEDNPPNDLPEGGEAEAEGDTTGETTDSSTTGDTESTDTETGETTGEESTDTGTETGEVPIEEVLVDLACGDDGLNPGDPGNKEHCGVGDPYQVSVKAEGADGCEIIARTLQPSQEVLDKAGVQGLFVLVPGVFDPGLDEISGEVKSDAGGILGQVEGHCWQGDKNAPTQEISEFVEETFSSK